MPPVPSGTAQSPFSQKPIVEKKLSGATSSSYRERRKEQVVLPEQSTVSQVQEALDSLTSLPQNVGRTAERRASPQAPSAVEETRVQKPRAVKILTFEGEVDPFQFTVLSTGPVVFFRKAWRNNLRYLLDVVRSKISTQVEASGFALRFLEGGSAEDIAAASVLAEEDAFVQICINLVDNALKFSASAEVKRIDIGLRRHASLPRHAVLFVRDYGPGVARDQTQRIFQLFYRAEDELTRQTKGTGIGLALVQALAAKMHATVALQNHHPGAEFQLIIPTSGAGRAA